MLPKGLPYMLERAGLDVQQGSKSYNNTNRTKTLIFKINLNLMKKQIHFFCHFL